LITKLPAPPELVTLQEILSDNAKEYIGTAVQNWCREHWASGNIDAAHSRSKIPVEPRIILVEDVTV